MLPVISKIFETVIHEQLSEYFIPNNLFCPQQYGFRKKSSTELAALELLDRVLDQTDKHKIPIIFYIDLSKSFDNLRHDNFLDKLTYYGVTHPAKKLIESYLSNRKQFVQVGNIKSTTPLFVHYVFFTGYIYFNMSNKKLPYHTICLLHSIRSNIIFT